MADEPSCGSLVRLSLTLERLLHIVPCVGAVVISWPSWSNFSAHGRKENYS